MSSQHYEAARSLRSTLDANARKAGDTPVLAESIQALRDADLFGIMTPRAVGGGELPLTEVLDIFAETARADGSTGWCLMASASAIAYFGSYLSDDAVERLFADGLPLAAGQFAPNGMATEEAGGYRLTGSYHFGSGIDYATHVGAGFLLPPSDGSEDPPKYLFGLMPRADVVLEGGWDVMGLTSTASLDYRVDGALVDPDYTFLFAAPTRHRGGPIYDLGVVALTAIGHAGFAMGLIRRALDELTSIAKTKVRMGAGSFMRDSEAFLLTLGTLESRYCSVVSWVRETVGAIEHHVNETGDVDVALINRLRQATVHVTQEGGDIIRTAYLTAGTSGLRRGPLERCFRDIHAGTQHFFASPASTLDMARNLMDAAPDDALEA